MLITEQIIQKQDMVDFANDLFDDFIFPPFVFDNNKIQKGIVIGLKDGDTPIGMSFGVVLNRTHTFFFHFVYVEKAHRNTDIVLFLLRRTFETVRDTENAESVIWSYSLLSGEKDIKPKLIQRIPFCEIDEIDEINNYMIRTNEFSSIKKFQQYISHNLEDKGYTPVNWYECPEGIKNVIREKEKTITDSRGYLSPFFIEGEFDPAKEEKRLSFVLVKNKTQEPVGWIMCQQTSECIARILSFYVYEDQRLGVVALSFLVYVMNIMSQLYTELHCGIRKNNPRMDNFVQYSCKDVLNLICIKYILKIKLK